MKRETLGYLLAVSVLFNVGAVAAAAYQAWRHAQAQPPDIAQHLRLDPAQARRWKELETSFVAELDAEWAEIGRRRESLVRAIFAAQADPQAIERHRAAIAELQARQQRRVIEQLVKERELLAPAQRDELASLLLRHREPAAQERHLHGQ